MRDIIAVLIAAMYAIGIVWIILSDINALASGLIMFGTLPVVILTMCYITEKEEDD